MTIRLKTARQERILKATLITLIPIASAAVLWAYQRFSLRPTPALFTPPLDLFHTMLEAKLAGELLATLLALVLVARTCWVALSIRGVRKGMTEDQIIDRQQPLLLGAILVAVLLTSVTLRTIAAHSTPAQFSLAHDFLGVQAGLLAAWLLVTMFGPERQWEARLPWVTVEEEAESWRSS